MQELVLEEHENFNIELQRSRSIAIAILGRQCLMGRLLLQSSMQLIGLVDQLSVHIWQDGDHRTGNQMRQSWTDQKIWLSGVSVSVVHWCRSVLLSFSTCYQGILGLEGAISCILARTSHQRTNSHQRTTFEKRTKALLPKCPLFRGSTVYYSAMCPLVPSLIRFMIYIKNHKGGLQVHGHTVHVLFHDHQKVLS